MYMCGVLTTILYLPSIVICQTISMSNKKKENVPMQTS